METQELTIKELVHKHDERNVLVTGLTQESGVLNNKFKYDYVTDVVVDTGHSFFFEHERRHIPGLLLIEAVRQNTIAISHRFLHIPLSMSFIMSEFNNKFPNFAKLDYPVKIYMQISKLESRSDRMSNYFMEALLLQKGLEVLSSQGSFSITTDDVVQRLEKLALRKVHG